MSLPTLDTAELEHVLGGLSLPLSMQPDHRFDDEGPLLTEALRRGLEPPTHSSRPAPRPGLKKSTTNPGWCDDGFGIVPCR
jgi:hypothetical protein